MDGCSEFHTLGQQLHPGNMGFSHSLELVDMGQETLPNKSDMNGCHLAIQSMCSYFFG